ncbi:YaaR family protein [Proteinivorax hydrogeniformans]|uniref:YaaR family protein n=1 Tax=Proteinivorax hydrogeniformans TaxID=1826727 RepID=A0AAU8HWC6_9FIRM
MARISHTKHKPAGGTKLTSLIKTNHKTTTTQNVSDFDLQFKISSVKEQLDQILDDIDQQGQTLSKSMTLDHLKKYHNLVASYIKKATNEMYELKIRSGEYYNPHKLYITVDNIDKELENITNEMLNSEKDRMYILDKINYIKGLLINISV